MNLLYHYLPTGLMKSIGVGEAYKINMVLTKNLFFNVFTKKTQKFIKSLGFIFPLLMTMWLHFADLALCVHVELFRVILRF